MRYLYGRNRADWVMQAGELTESGGLVPELVPDTAVTLWDAETGGLQVTDLLDPDSMTPLGSSISTDVDGNIPAFLGPDGTTTLWGSASLDGSATRYAMVPVDLGDEITNLDTRVTTLEAGGSPSGVPETLRFSAATITEAQAASPPAPHRAYNLTGSTVTILSIHVSADTAPATNDLIVDVEVDGSSIFADPGDRPTIPATANTSGTVTSGFTASVSAGSYLTVVPAQGDDDAEAITTAVRWT